MGSVVYVCWDFYESNTFDLIVANNASLPPLTKNTSTGLIIYNTRLYTGREYDTETGLYYLRARHYDPISGRFLQRDPIGTKDDSNLYRYVRNNPLTFTDPSGLRAKAAIEFGGNVLILAFGIDTTNAPGVNNYDEVMTRGKILQDQVDNPTGLALGASMFLPVPGGKKVAGERVLKDLPKIVNGHAIKHLDEFEKFGVKSIDELEEFGKSIINSAIEKGNIKSLSGGRTMIWDDITETVIFGDPGRKDLGTIFIHNMEKTRKIFTDYIKDQF